MRNSYDGEIGRGRRTGGDSSSSRESSLGRTAPKRPFSPVGSDAGEPSLTAELTPGTRSPPSDRPLIRQAVAFASDTPPQNIVTYEATPAPNANATVHFLPGQEVPAPTKKKTKRTKKGDLFSAQTSKFRIDTYDPTPSTQPPIAHGNGPYSSMYRGTPAPPKLSRKVSPATTTTSSTYATNSSTASSNPPSTYAPQYVIPSASTQSLQPAPPPPPPVGASSSSPTSTGLGPPPHFAEMSDARNPHSFDYYPSYPHLPGPNSSGAYNPSSYYRYDYERGTWDSEYSRSSRRLHRSMDHSQERDSGRYHSRGSGRSNQGSGRSNQGSNSAHRSKHPLRMLTLLIQDVRSGTTDHQLAEVKVPLRHADDAGNAFWADARDITEQLQQGPSRIDGPAKVYTLRGKYRQFILRVSKENDDEFLSANVAVAGDKTVDLVVELLTPPGVLPAPPKIPSGLVDSPSPPYDDYEQESNADLMNVEAGQKQPDQTQDSRKRVNSTSFDDYNGPDSPPPSKVIRHNYPSESLRHNTQRHRSLESMSSSAPPPEGTEVISVPLISSSPRPGVEVEIVRTIKEKVRAFDTKGFAEFFRSNAGTTLADTLSQYRYFKNISKKFVGLYLDKFQYTIEEKDLIKLLKIEDPTFVEDCKKTLRLMPLYGEPTSSRYDPKINEMVNANFTQSKEHARQELLKLLHRNDNIWNNRPPDEPSFSSNKSQTSSSDSISSRDEPNIAARANKSMFVE